VVISGDRAVLAWRWSGNLPGIERTWHFWRAMRKSSGGQRLTCFILTREFQPGPVMCGNRAKSKRPFLLLLKNTLASKRVIRADCLESGVTVGCKSYIGRDWAVLHIDRAAI
jgi:hypothetical protein